MTHRRSRNEAAASDGAVIVLHPVISGERWRWLLFINRACLRVLPGLESCSAHASPAVGCRVEIDTVGSVADQMDMKAEALSLPADIKRLQDAATRPSRNDRSQG